MKKKISLIVALVMVLCPMIAMLTSVSVSAAALGRNYDFYQSNIEITVDGNPSEWDRVDWSDAFVNESNTNPSLNSAVNVAYKALWAETDDREKIDVYYMLKVEGALASVVSRLIRINMKSNNASFQTDAISLLADAALTNKSNTTLTYSYAVDKQDNGIVILEVKTTVAKPTDSVLSLNIWYREYGSWSTFQQNSWNMDGDYGATGVGNIKAELRGSEVPNENDDVLLKKDGQLIASRNKDAEGKIVLPNFTNVKRAIMLGWQDADGKVWQVGSTYTVEGTDQVVLDAMVLSIDLLPGASVLIEDPTALRFDVETSANIMTALGSAVQEFGVVMTQTSNLNAAIIQDTVITAEELDAAQVAYEKIALTASEKRGIYHAVKENISDISVKYSACPYITVHYADDSTQTFNVAGYSAADHSRSVKMVAEAAYEDRSNLRGTAGEMNYMFKISSSYATGDYTMFSYSPYTEEQLDLLAAFKQ